MNARAAGERTFDLHGAPGHLIRRVQQIHTAVFAQLVDDPELTTPQFAVLAALHRSPEINQVRLAAELDIDRSTIADISGRLAARGLIERHQDPRDRRRNVLALTADGEQVYRRALPRVAEVSQHLVDPLEDDERQAFLAQLARIVDEGQARP